MAHAGFPNGLGTSVCDVQKKLENNSDETFRLHIIEFDNKPIGEIHYKNKGNKIAEIGIKICDLKSQGKGLGTQILSMFIGSLFNEQGYNKIVLDTNKENKIARHVYEKLGFKVAGIRENSWVNQVGEMQSAACYVLTKEEWQKI